MTSLNKTTGASRVNISFRFENRNAATTLREEFGWGDTLGTSLQALDYTLVVERMYIWYETVSYVGGGTLTTTVDLFKSLVGGDKVFNTITNATTTTDDSTRLRLDADTADYANGEAGATITGSGEGLLVRIGYQMSAGTCRIDNAHGILVCRSLGS